MSETISLDRAIFGKNPAVEEGSEHLIVMAMSSNLTPEDTDIWRGSVTLEPFDDVPAGTVTEAIGLFNGPDSNFILVQADNHHGDATSLHYQYILLPRPVLLTMTGNLTSLVDTARNAFPDTFSDAPLIPLEIPIPEEHQLIERQSFFNTLLSEDNTITMPVLLAVLDAALSEQQVMLLNFAPDLDARIALIQALIFLLPAPVRDEITFATNVSGDEPARSRIVFSEQPIETTRQVIDMASDDSDDALLHLPYVQCLSQLWQGDLQTFVAELDKLEWSADTFLSAFTVQDGLTRMAERYWLDLDVRSQTEVPIERILDVLNNHPPPPGELHQRYVERLLDYVLLERDPEYTALIIQYMDEDSNLRDYLCNQLTQALDTEPDAVYFFVRTRLSQGVDPAWLPMLQQAASASLHMALEGDDNDILMDWLELVAREPEGYQLQDVLREGIQATQEQAQNDGDLGERLLLFICRRRPAIIKTVLNDKAVMTGMAAPLGPALRDYDAESISATFDLGHEISLVLMGCAVQDASSNAPAAAIFTPDNITYLWSMGYGEDVSVHLTEPYLPTQTIQVLAEAGAEWLPEESLQTLLTHIVAAEEATLLQRISTQLSERDTLVPMLVVALQDSALPAENILSLVAESDVEEMLVPQQTVDLYLRLIEFYDWQRESVQPLVEQITRLMQQHNEIAVSVDILWQMLQIAIDGDVDIVTRVVTRHILAHVETLDDGPQLIEILERLHTQLQSDPASLNYLLNWWREFVHRQPPAHLQQLDKLLAEKRELEGVHSVIQTSIAIKKAIGSQSLEGFANGINVAFTIMQALSDSFDPVNRPVLNFDQDTVWAELDARASELTADERRVLAKNLKELAHLIIVMADHRSKSSIMRREEDIERQLYSGEQAPHSAIDTMKWLSGYLNGTQSDEEE